MVNYSPAFGHSGNRRFPTPAENSEGFPCSGADYSLFNGLEYGAQAEIGAVITGAGLTPTNSDLRQLRKAISLMIQEAIEDIELPSAPPDPDLSDFLTLNMARARLPILPYVRRSSGLAGVYSPSIGKVRIPGNVPICHRGIYQFSSHETTFSTAPNKTYHVRWQWDGASNYVLKDLSDPGYNPDGAAETSTRFDSSLDDMLLARVVTTGSNSCQVTDLRNLLELSAQRIVLWNCTPAALDWRTANGTGLTLNWARTPTIATLGMQMAKSNQTDVDGIAYAVSFIGNFKQIGIRKRMVTRYACADFQYTYWDSVNNYGYLRAEWNVEA